ncbi:MAG: sigma-70 family RNA polymerase sigma factor [Oscillospiraceae bacterium]
MISIDEAINKYTDMVYRLALSRTKKVCDAEDILQDVFYSLIKNFNKINDEEHLKAWLIKVTINKTISFFNSSNKKKNIALSEDLAYLPKEKSDVYYAVMNLKKDYRTVIHLFYYEDLSVLEISAILKQKESTIRSKLHRARNLLKEKLEGSSL